ncbi:DUF3418 domain-containing protein [Patulibacter brassicae]|uniref:DUF3418 domain-containing protein n=1 Tax=Patulibacter brassicae TaxID=1705717 RepID=A0ABU4VGJ0_9ACTN|nr:DUF3418 domain-containing protein [Patulibacter brassicae]MDX8150824.1 DUF3418 domain-containing protein [Patulibacter brassicae]
MPDAPSTPDLRERLAGLSLRDEHRLARRVDRVRHQRDDAVRERELGRLVGEIERAEQRIAARVAARPERISYPEELPVSARRDDLLAALRDHQVVVVAGETGSGKTTQIPKLLLELGRGIRGTIAHTQPRRIAARTVAQRIADELHVELGDAVGYSVRFNDQASERTLVRLMTDGLLLAEIQRDRLLRRYDTIVVDEAHERSLNIDFLLGCLTQILPKRPELQVVITSATIDPERFADHFSSALGGVEVPIVEVSGRTYPVDVWYRPLREDDEDAPDGPGPDPDAGADGRSPHRSGDGAGDDRARGDRRGDGRGPRRGGRPGGRAGETGERDQADGIADAVEELLDHHRRHRTDGAQGDVLVFLSGEREIRDTAEVLAGRLRDRREPVEVLPLYARLSAAEQQRIFQPHRGRRVVLATNVAETSLTVPGITYVVDAGTARISRYSARLKVQRLPIEPISQASANQRTGRCGRVADGICVRLYSERDFAARPEFTDPEILRTNLASVILQMAALELGAVEAFPFVEPPDARQVRDGVLLLEELGALRDGRLTPLGRRIAALPVDPRMARMIVAGHEQGCTDELLVIAAALSIQDPRERPVEEQGSADQAHARFRDERSDFLAYLHLWRYLRGLQRELSGSQFRKRLKREHLHYLRIREWQDLVGQLRQAAKQVGITVPRGARADEREPAAVGAGTPRASRRGDRGRDAPSSGEERPGPGGPRAGELAEGIGDAESERIHAALLSGLLSHVGLRDTPTEKPRPGQKPGRDRRGRRIAVEFQGARNSRFQLFPGSALARKPPTWVVVAELVETSRLFGRTAAKVEPRWIEPLAEHLLKRTYSEPRWDRQRGAVVATERALLYGLPVVAGRAVPYGKLDPVVAREIFLRTALVEGDWDGGRRGGAEILAENARRIAEVEALEERQRRRGLLVDDEVLYAFLDARLPAHVVGGVEFDRWWRDARREDPDRLTYPRELLLREEAAAPSGQEDARLRPGAWKQGELTLPLSYRFEPGSDHDGVTVHVPLTALPQLRPIGFEWLVPGFRAELVEALLRGLPKELRRELVPIPETAATLLERMTPRAAPLPTAMARELQELRRVRVSPADFDLAALPGHLRMTFRIEAPDPGPDDPPLAEGHDLLALREQLTPRLRAALAAATPSLERDGLTSWTVGDLPRTVELPGTGGAVRSFPALVDQGDAVGVRTFDSPAAQAAAMRAGTRRLLRLTLPRPSPRLDTAAGLTLATAPHGSLDAVLEDVALATIDGLLEHRGGPVWDEAGFTALRASIGERLPAAVGQVLGQVVRVLDAERAVRRTLEDLAQRPATAERFADAIHDVGAQLRRLVHPGFVLEAGPRRLPDVVRYLQGAQRRLERLADVAAQDRDRMATIHELERAYAARLERWPRGIPRPAELREVPWLLEELRLDQLAGGAGRRVVAGPGGATPGAVSAKRIRRTIETAAPPR